MKTSLIICTVRCHAEGEVGDVYVGAASRPPSAAVWQQSRWIVSDDSLHNVMQNKLGGTELRPVNLLVSPVSR